MTTYDISVNAVSKSTPALTSTKVKVATSTAVYYAVGVNPTANSANCAIIPANVVKDINVGYGNLTTGLGNKIAFQQVSTSGNVSVTEIGSVDFTKVIA